LAGAVSWPYALGWLVLIVDVLGAAAVWLRSGRFSLWSLGDLLVTPVTGWVGLDRIIAILWNDLPVGLLVVFVLVPILRWLVSPLRIRAGVSVRRLQRQRRALVASPRLRLVGE
jgi:hypothetical protein